MNTSSMDLLQKAKVALTAEHARYRDGLLEVGRLLHAFVLARLEEGRGLSEKKRLEGRFTRMCAIRDACTELKATCTKINNLIAAAMAVELLWQNQSLESLPHNALRFFAVFLDRKTDKTGESHHDMHYDTTLPETWFVRPEMEARAKATFAQAVAEGWKVDRVKQAIADVERKPRGKCRAERMRERRIRSAVGNHGEVAFPVDVAASGDVADYLVGLVEKSSDPREVAMLLQAKLQAIVHRRQAFVFA